MFLDLSGVGLSAESPEELDDWTLIATVDDINPALP